MNKDLMLNIFDTMTEDEKDAVLKFAIVYLGYKIGIEKVLEILQETKEKVGKK